jgi:ATP-dependent RNA helicase RhlE
VHRIGRTGRAGAEGEAVSLVCVDENSFLADIEKLIKRSIPKEVVPGFEPDPNERAEPILLGRRTIGAPGARSGGGGGRSGGSGRPGGGGGGGGGQRSAGRGGQGGGQGSGQRSGGGGGGAGGRSGGGTSRPRSR